MVIQFGRRMTKDGHRRRRIPSRATVPAANLIDVKDAASICCPSSANRHRTEFAAKAIIAIAVRMIIFKSGFCFARLRSGLGGRQTVGASFVLKTRRDIVLPGETPQPDRPCQTIYAAWCRSYMRSCKDLGFEAPARPYRQNHRSIQASPYRRG